jgi:hypothetical protein
MFVWCWEFIVVGSEESGSSDRVSSVLGIIEGADPSRLLHHEDNNLLFYLLIEENCNLLLNQPTYLYVFRQPSLHW